MVPPWCKYLVALIVRSGVKRVTVPVLGTHVVYCWGVPELANLTRADGEEFRAPAP
jgi:hypothetical protein